MDRRNTRTRLHTWLKAGTLGAAFALVGTHARAQNVIVNPGAGSYPTLTDAFTAINAGTHTGAITVDIVNSTTEGSGTAVLNASGVGAASYTSILIQPSGGAARSITGATTAGSPLIDLSGADNVTIDGLNTGGNTLTIENTTVSATTGTSTIRFIGGATGNTITNCALKGAVSSSVATNGAIVFFSTDGVTANGNDNNTISNCDIGPSGANLPTKAILGNGSTGTAAIGNSGIVINNNDIHDYFGAAVTSSGIAINGGCQGWSITNNRFYQTGTRTWTTGSTHRAIDLSSASATVGVMGMTVTGNIIGYASNTQTGTYTLTGTGTGAKFQGIVHNGPDGGTLSNISNNTVASVSMTGVTSSGTGTSSPFLAIMFQNGVGNTNGNIIGSQSATGSLTFSTTTTSSTDIYGLFNFSFDSWTANSNQIGGISVTNLGASGTFIVYGMRANTTTTDQFNATSNLVGGTVANSIQLTATGVSSQVMGMQTPNAISTWTSNTVRNLTNNIGTGTTSGASVIGMAFTSTTPIQTVSQNTIHSLTNTNATAATVVTGIQFTGGNGNLVERNLIYGLTSATTSASAEVNGIRVAGGTTTYRNNMIALGAGIANAIGTAPTNSSTSGIIGFNEALGTNTILHNSIYIGGTATAGSGPSIAFNGVQTTNTRSFRDNIFQNARTNSGATGSHYAIKVNGTTPNPTGLTINNNLYFSNGASGAVFGFFNSANVANIAAWRTAVGQDANSFESNPQYNDPTNATPDLHLHPTNPTVAEGNGADLGVALDYDGQTRSGLTPVDLGADAGNYVTIDLAGPSITYTPLGNTISTSNRVQATTITDPGSGVPVAGIGLPVIYYQKNVGGWFSNQCVSTGGNGYDCTIDYSLVGGVLAGDQITYYVAAQDQAGTPNVSVNPSAGATGFSSNPPAVSTPPTTPNSYFIASAISGTVNVGSAETFTSLTRNDAQGLFRYINNNVVTGDITVECTSDLLIEDGAVALNAFDSPWTITIKPNGAPRTISGAAAATALIRTNGASRVTIDGSTSGGTDRSLTITNTSVTTPQVVRFSSIGTTPITSLTLKNCIVINGVNTSSAVVMTDNAGAAEYFTNITIQNNDVRRSFIGVYANAVVQAGNGSGLLYTQNTLNTAGADAIRLCALYVQGVDGATVSNNTLGNFESTTAEGKTGIWLATGTVNSTVSGNTVSTIGHTTVGSTSAVFGIRDSGGAAASGNTITGNSISAIVANFGASAGVCGIGCSSGGTTIQRNNIQGINNTHTGTWPAIGIDIVSGNNCVVKNNFISDVTGNMTGGAAFSPSFGLFGIRLQAGTGHAILNNSVNLFGLRAGTATTSLLTAGLAIASTASTGLDVRNNILANNITGGLSPTANVAIYLPSGGGAGMALLNNKNSYYSGSGALAGVGQQGTTATNPNLATLPALLGYTSTLGNATNDNASTASTGAVPYATSTDLHITTAATEWATGATIGSVANDFDGDARPQGLSYDKGADEVLYSCSAPTASVGGPQSICALGTTAGLGGNAPAPGTGTWSVESGGAGTFAPNANDPNATFTHTSGAGPIVLRWTITEPDCPTTTADVTVSIPVCDDSDPCTTDACVGGVCQYTPIVCDDSDPCTTDACVGGVCVYTPIVCDDSDPCTTDACVGGVCVYTPIVCDDSDPCTTDACVGGVCVFTPIVCDDSDPCTTDACVGGVCVYTPIVCDDSDPCTTDACVGGVCVFTPIVCDDSDPCTTDACVGGVCQYTFEDADGDGICDANDDCPFVFGEQGDPCDDFNPFTINDLINGSCVCAGTPVPCTEDVVLEFRTDDNGSQISWEIKDDTSPFVVCSGNSYSDNTTYTLPPCCLVPGCYVLSFFDSFGDGLCCSTPVNEAGYRLFDENGKRIIDSWQNGAFGSTSSIGQPFCVPLGSDKMTVSSCDREDLLPTSVVVASANPLVSAEFGVTNATSGYSFWIYDPHGSYSRRIFLSHASPGHTIAPGPTEAAHLRLSQIISNPVPQNILLNIRVRGRVAGNYLEFGPACRLKIDASAAFCPAAHLDDNPLNVGTTFSCGVNGKVVGASGNAGKIWASPAVRNPGAIPANRYQFTMAVPAEGYTRTITTTSYVLVLGAWVANPLLCGTYTYDVTVRASFDAGASWCPTGKTCTVEITNNGGPTPCTAPFTGGGGHLSTITTTEPSSLALWPNPNRGDQLYVQLGGIDPAVVQVTIDVHDLFGKRVIAEAVATGGGDLNHVMQLGNTMASGVYTVTVTAGSLITTQRLVIQ